MCAADCGDQPVVAACVAASVALTVSDARNSSPFPRVGRGVDIVFCKLSLHPFFGCPTLIQTTFFLII